MWTKKSYKNNVNIRTSIKIDKKALRKYMFNVIIIFTILFRNLS